MAYIALYRKWRPTVFEDVVGQEHITKTLKNQIKNNNIAHAYLFCGTRGTGKTSTAKIFARAVNCVQPIDYNPCNQCEICTSIQHENTIDVIEIDAASNNGVDDVRELRENVKYPPTKARYKVYIIDEVHMLSTGAFNALLKTLEEPPHYVIFILATTEPHKIPATILSRCQRFDFKRVSEVDIVKRLDYICKQSTIEAEEKALQLIARNSEGAMRDALSLLDQCISFSEGRIDYNHVMDILGVVRDDVLFDLVDAIIEKDSLKAIEWIEELVRSGKDIHQFIKDMIGHYRNLMITKVSEKGIEEIIQLSTENIERLKRQSQKMTMNAIIRAIHLLSETEADAKWSTLPRVILEVAVIQLIRPASDSSMEGLIERIETLEKIIQSNGTQTTEISISHEMRQDIKQETETKEEFIEKKQKDSQQSSMPLKEKAKPEDFKMFMKHWDEILKEIKKKKISIYAVLMEGKPVAIDQNSLIIAFEDGYGFHKEAVNSSSYKEFIQEIIEDITGKKIELKCIMKDEMKNMIEKKDIVSSTNGDVETKKIIELFGEGLVDIVEE